MNSLQNNVRFMTIGSRDICRHDVIRTCAI